MAVGPAIKMWSKTGGSITTKDGRKKQVTITDGYTVVSDPDDTWEDVTAAEGLPQTGDIRPGFWSVICTRKTPRRLSPIYWVIDITYEGEIGPNGIKQHPIYDPPEIEWSRTESEEEIDEDVNGAPITTANGERFEGVTMQLADLYLSVKRNYLAVNLAATYQYMHSTNSDNFATMPAGTGKLVAFNAKQVIAEEVGGYWEVTAGIQFRYPWRTTPAKAWWKRLRHEGFYKRIDDGGTEKVVRATDKAKEPVVRPVLLDADGFQIDDPANATWKEFQVYQSLPYNALGLL